MIDSTRTALAVVTVDTKPAKKFASWWARDIIKRDRRLNRPARALLMVLASHADANYWCRVSVPKLADELGCGDRAVQRARAVLEAAGLVVVEYGPGRKHANRYWLPVAGVVPKPARQPAQRRISTKVSPVFTKVSPVTPIRPLHPAADIHKGVDSDVTKVSLTTPEVDNEVSREHRMTGSLGSTPAASFASGFPLDDDGPGGWWRYEPGA